MQLEAYFEFLAPNDIRVKGTRIGIETILYDVIHRNRTPDEIVATYPSLTLEQVYATMTYYLHNQERLNAYLVEWYEHGAHMHAEQERHPSPAIVRLRQLKAERAAAQQTVPAPEPAAYS